MSGVQVYKIAVPKYGGILYEDELWIVVHKGSLPFPAILMGIGNFFSRLGTPYIALTHLTPPRKRSVKRLRGYGKVGNPRLVKFCNLTGEKNVDAPWALVR